MDANKLEEARARSARLRADALRFYDGKIPGVVLQVPVAVVTGISPSGVLECHLLPGGIDQLFEAGEGAFVYLHREPVNYEPTATLYVAKRDGRTANVLANVVDLPEGAYKLYRGALPVHRIDLGQLPRYSKSYSEGVYEDDAGDWVRFADVLALIDGRVAGAEVGRG